MTVEEPAIEMDHDRLRLLALNMDREIGPHAAAATLYRMYGRRHVSLFTRATQVDPSQPPTWPRLPAGVDERTLSEVQYDKAKMELRGAEKEGVDVTTWLDEDYPLNLRHIVCPPPVLYRKGTLTRGDWLAVAIVGSRRATPDYLDFTARLGFELAKAGITVVSGLARGIDRAAHEGALEANGRTIAVLGTGVDVCYPRSHAHLASRIAERGALLTYYPLGTPPFPYHFPARNWVISGLALVTVVVQCAQRSGALITAHYAAAQGRDVMAVPGDVNIPMSQGPNALLRDGAGVVNRPKDVIDSLEHDLSIFGISLSRPKAEGTRSKEKTLADRINDALGEEILEVDEIAKRLGESVDAVQRTLVRLELEGELVNLPGGRFRRKELR